MAEDIEVSRDTATQVCSLYQRKTGEGSPARWFRCYRMGSSGVLSVKPLLYDINKTALQ